MVRSRVDWGNRRLSGVKPSTVFGDTLHGTSPYPYVHTYIYMYIHLSDIYAQRPLQGLPFFEYKTIYIYIHMNKAYLLVWINESVQSIYLQKQANTSSLSICKANVLVWTNTSSHLQTKHVWAHFPTLPSLCIRSIHQNAPSKKNETNSKQQKKNTKNRKHRKKPSLTGKCLGTQHSI